MVSFHVMLAITDMRWSSEENGKRFRIVMLCGRRRAKVLFESLTASDAAAAAAAAASASAAEDTSRSDATSGTTRLAAVPMPGTEEVPSPLPPLASYRAPVVAIIVHPTA